MSFSVKGIFHIYKSKGVIAIPARLWRDTSFPFSDKQEVEIVVNSTESLTVRKVIKGQKRLTDGDK